MVGPNTDHRTQNLDFPTALSFSASRFRSAIFNNAYKLCNLGISKPFSLAILNGFPSMTYSSIGFPPCQSSNILGLLPLEFFLVDFKICSAVANEEGKVRLRFSALS